MHHVNPAFYVGYVIGALLAGFIGMAIGTSRHGAFQSFFVGLFLGFVGWVLLCFDWGAKVGLALVLLIFGGAILIGLSGTYARYHYDAADRAPSYGQGSLAQDPDLSRSLGPSHEDSHDSPSSSSGESHGFIPPVFGSAPVEPPAPSPYAGNASPQDAAAAQARANARAALEIARKYGSH